MNRNAGESLPTLLAGALFAVGLVLYSQWQTLLRWTATDTSVSGLLWLHATDVAPGDEIEGRIRIADGLRVAITSVVARGPTGEQKLWSARQPWDDTIEVTTRSFRGGPAWVEHNGSDEVSFVWRVPESAPVDNAFALELETKFVVAEDQVLGRGFVDKYRTDTFVENLDIHSRSTSILRRLAKAALALASLLGTIFVMVVVPRRFPNSRLLTIGAIVLFVPWLILGWVWFGTLISHASRLHGWWLVVICLLVWGSAPFIAMRITRDDRFATYLAHPTLIPSTGDIAYRSANVELSYLPLSELEAVLVGQGMAVYRRGKELIVLNGAKLSDRQVRLAIPHDELFGGGQPICMRADDRPFVQEIAALLGSRLGELKLELVASANV